LVDGGNVRRITFAKAAEQYIEAHRAGWRDRRAAATWASTLATYANPVIGSLGVDTISTQHIMAILKPIWSAKAETASRVRGRVEVILNWCTAQHFRTGANPATWKGNIQALLPAKGKVKAPTKHHPAVPLDKLPQVYRRLAESRDLAAAAARFCVLCAARPGEAAGARWSEIDLKTATWVIPPERMKAGREHRVALSPQALAILKAVAGLDDVRVFTGLLPKAMGGALRDAGGGAGTVHGTSRAAFDDYAHEFTSFAPALVDRALAHVVGSKTTMAYRRSDLLEQRRELMQSWGNFLHA
jgi:integrase